MGVQVRYGGRGGEKGEGGEEGCWEVGWTRDEGELLSLIFLLLLCDFVGICESERGGAGVGGEGGA